MSFFKAITILTIGLLTIGIAIYRIARVKRLLKNGIRVRGSIVNLIKTLNKGNVIYYPIVNFKTTDGVEHEFKYEDGSYPSVYKKGEEVEVIYMINKKIDFIIINKQIMYLDYIILVIGVIISFFSLFNIL